jgi:hypothetical protein
MLSIVVQLSFSFIFRRKEIDTTCPPAASILAKWQRASMHCDLRTTFNRGWDTLLTDDEVFGFGRAHPESRRGRSIESARPEVRPRVMSPN